MAGHGRGRKRYSTHNGLWQFMERPKHWRDTAKVKFKRCPICGIADTKHEHLTVKEYEHRKREEAKA